MERIEFYRDIIQRDNLKQRANTIGESTIHDDFIDINGNPTDGTSGKLTFDIKPDPVQRPKRDLSETDFINELANERDVRII